MKLNREMEAYIRASQEELKQLIRDLCRIPAPLGCEDARAEFCRRWFAENGAQEVYIDEAKNVICTLGDTGSNELIAFTAHTDTVFPDTEAMPFEEKDGMMYCPGVTDDTASLAVMMICARYLFQNGWTGDCGLIFAADSGEEGLGNLKGCRKLMENYGSRIRELITLDGTKLNSVVTEAVGSHRYRVSVRTEGGHSFGSFGKPNAIHQLSRIIDDLYAVEVPRQENSRTTYNVGVISGGTSVNTIAQYAEMYYEYRSDSLACMQQMESMFSFIINLHRMKGVDVAVEKIGDRPCSGEVDFQRRQALIGRAEESIRGVLGMDTVFSCGSTDANMPLSMGIPAICISVCDGGKCHTREEWLDTGSLPDGCRLLMDFLYRSK